MSKTPIYVALVLEKFYPLTTLGINDVINLINKQFPNNLVTIKQYEIISTPEELKFVIDDFILAYPLGNRVTISFSSSNLKFISEYINNLGLNIPSFSMSGTSPLIKTFSNVLTYAPIDIYSVMSQFLIYKDYQMEQIKILYQQNSNNKIFFETYLEQIKIQAELLSVKYDIEFLEIGKNFYNILPKSMILILAQTPFLNDFVNKEFIDLIPPKCYITLTDATVNITDIFGNIPTIVLSPYPIDYTETSALVYNSLTNKKSNSYSLYTFYDILYSLVFFTNTNLTLTIENYLSVNPFQSGVSPAFIAAQSNFNPKFNGYDYGVYQAVFTKNSLVQNNNELFEKYNIGGTLSLPDSNSIFKTLGIVPFFNFNIFYGDDDYYKIYDECGNLIVTRFASNITDFPIKQNSKVNISQHVENKFYCKYTTDGYFSYLEKVINVFGSNPQVNLTMGKQPVNKVFVLN